MMVGNNEKEVKLKEYRYTGKERDDFTGLYYYGARYYASWLGRWLTCDPKMQEGGSLNKYLYCNDNPVEYIDPDGKAIGKLIIDTLIENGKIKFRINSGWGHDAPQKILGYFDFYDDIVNKLGLVDIHATKFDIGNITLRLWKGDYKRFGGSGGEFGFYYKDSGKSVSREDLKKLGLKSTSISVVTKDTASEVAFMKFEKPSYWISVFNIFNKNDKNNLYTINMMEFDTEKQAREFAYMLNMPKVKEKAENYRHNNGEAIQVFSLDNYVFINYGKTFKEIPKTKEELLSYLNENSNDFQTISESSKVLMDRMTDMQDILKKLPEEMPELLDKLPEYINELPDDIKKKIPIEINKKPKEINRLPIDIKA